MEVTDDGDEFVMAAKFAHDFTQSYLADSFKWFCQVHKCGLKVTTLLCGHNDNAGGKQRLYRLFIYLLENHKGSQGILFALDVVRIGEAAHESGLAS